MCFSFLLSPPLTEIFQQYLTNTKEIYNAMVQIVDFYLATEETRKTINLEIYKQTQGKKGKGFLSRQ